MPTDGRGALFLMPTSASGESGPLAIWIEAASWAASARKKFGASWIVTPEGTLSVEEALDLASSTSLAPHSSARWRRRVPLPIRTAAKDLAALARARRFRGAGMRGPWVNSDLAFVWQHHELFQTAGHVAARAMRRPLVLFIDAPQVWEDRSWGVRRPGWARLTESLGEGRSFRTADVLACVSEEVAAEVSARGAPENRIVVTPCGVDLDRFSPAVSGVAVREQYGLQDKFVVGWVGSFRPFHGVDLALETAVLLREEVPDLALLLVGDGQERPRVQERARSLGLGNVSFTGTVPYDRMAAHVAAMDVALLLHDGRQEFHYSPIKLREYMAGGKPVVAPRVGQVARSLDDGVDALLVESGNGAAVARAIAGLRSDEGLRRRLGAAARLESGAWSWDAQVERTCAALERHAPVKR